MVLLLFFISNLYSNQQKKLAYIVSDINIPFWQIISKGIKDKSNELGYEIHIYSSNNLKKNELENLASAISLKIDGLIISPINSSTASTLLEIANMNKIPIPVPPIEEQNRIVQEIESRLSVADKMEQSIQESLQKAEALRQSILKKAFCGELV